MLIQHLKPRRLHNCSFISALLLFLIKFLLISFIWLQEDELVIIKLLIDVRVLILSDREHVVNLIKVD